jgi:hypothetical protein
MSVDETFDIDTKDNEIDGKSGNNCSKHMSHHLHNLGVFSSCVPKMNKNGEKKAVLVMTSH